jgi:hypothetical protein
VFVRDAPNDPAIVSSAQDDWFRQVAFPHPDFVAFNRAMPHVKAMMSAIHRKNRTMAIESGNAALAEMNGVPVAQEDRSAKHLV